MSDYWHGWRVGAESTCPDCHERVVLGATRPPRWVHQPAGASFQDGQHLYCHRTTAHPSIRSWEHALLAPVPVYEDEPRRLALAERSLQELRLAVARDTGWDLDPTLPTQTWTLRTARIDPDDGGPLPPLWSLLTRWAEYT